MSAFIVNKKHIDALLTAAERVGIRNQSPFSWFAPEEPEGERDYQRGEPWGPTACDTASLRRRQLTSETADATGSMLYAANYASINHRYNSDDMPPVYNYQPYAGELTPVMILKAIDCFEYQSCEYPEWDESEAHEFCNCLRRRVIGDLPGYDDAPWELPNC